MAIISEHPWVELKRRNVFFFLAIITLPVFPTLISIFVSETLGESELFIHMVLLLALGYWRMRFICPRCKKPFFHTRTTFLGNEIPYHSFFTNKCLNCGLLQNCPPSADLEAEVDSQQIQGRKKQKGTS